MWFSHLEEASLSTPFSQQWDSSLKLKFLSEVQSLIFHAHPCALGFPSPLTVQLFPNKQPMTPMCVSGIYPQDQVFLASFPQKLPDSLYSP